METCLDQLDRFDNLWFDPLLPSEIVTFGDICEAISELYEKVKEKGVMDTQDVSIYSYVLIYQIFLNSMEEKVFETCVDSRILDEPAEYCKRKLMPNLNLVLWTNDKKEKTCDEAKEILEINCQDSENIVDCYPCAQMMNYIVLKYQKYTTIAIENMF